MPLSTFDKRDRLKLCDFGGASIDGRSPRSAMTDVVDILLSKVLTLLPR